MPQQKRKTGTARQKRNCWSRGNGTYSMKGELKGGISLNKKQLNRKLRHNKDFDASKSGYKRFCQTLKMIDFS